MRGFGVLGLMVALLCSGFAETAAQGQVFRKLFGPRGQSGCPGGNCPARPQLFRNAAPVSAGHWTFPGTIDGHLNGTHGVSTAGMSREQMLNLHDALHEGRSVSTVQSVSRPVVASPVINSVIIQPQPQPRPVAPAAPVIINAKPVAMAPVLAPALPGANDVGIELAIEPGFRGELRKAITEARKAGSIDVRTAFRLQTMTVSPAFVKAAQDVAVTQMVLSGESADSLPKGADGRVDVASINWGEFGKFLQLFIPLLLELIKGLGL